MRTSLIERLYTAKDSKHTQFSSQRQRLPVQYGEPCEGIKGGLLEGHGGICKVCEAKRRAERIKAARREKRRAGPGPDVYSDIAGWKKELLESERRWVKRVD